MMKTMCNTLGWIPEQKGKGKIKEEFFFLFFSSRKYTLKYFKILEHVYNLLSNDSEKNTYREIYGYMSKLDIFEELRKNNKAKMR